GWVPITAIPDEDNKIKPEPKSLQVPKPPILEDPEPPEEPAEAEAGKIDDEDKEEAESDGFDWGQALLIGVAVVVPLALLALPAGSTRREGAGMLARSYGATATIPLAHRADATVFGAGEPSEQEIEAFWADVDGVLGGLRSSVNRRARVRAALSLRSVRAGSGSSGPRRWLPRRGGPGGGAVPPAAGSSSGSTRRQGDES